MTEFMRVAKITLPLLMEGLVTTLEISLLAILLGLVLGAVFALLKIYGSKPLRAFAIGYIKLLRCIPFMVEVYLAYYGLPAIGIDVPAFWTGVIILGMYTGAYVAVIFESGLKSVPKGQEEAARAIGMSRGKTLVRILVPQTLSIVIPPLTGQLLQTVKDSSILSVITVTEMTMMTKEAIGITFSPLIVYICAGLFYWAINLVIELGAGNVEKRHRLRSI